MLGDFISHIMKKIEVISQEVLQPQICIDVQYELGYLWHLLYKWRQSWMALTDSDVDSVAKLIQVEWSNMSSCTCYLSAVWTKPKSRCWWWWWRAASFTMANMSFWFFSWTEIWWPWSPQSVIHVVFIAIITQSTLLMYCLEASMFPWYLHSCIQVRHVPHEMMLWLSELIQIGVDDRQNFCDTHKHRCHDCGVRKSYYHCFCYH